MECKNRCPQKPKICPCKEKEEEKQDCCSKPQIDTKDIFYKLEGECFSNLDALSIPKGASLEYILERLGFFIENFNYFDLTDNKYDAKSFKEFMTSLQGELQYISQNQNIFNQNLETLNDRLNNLESKVTSIEYPQITDTSGIGFTIQNNLKTILQKYSDNYVPKSM